MSLVVGYVLVVLDGNYYGGEGAEDQDGSSKGFGNLIGVLVVVGQLIVSVMLLFCVVSSHILNREIMFCTANNGVQYRLHGQRYNSNGCHSKYHKLHICWNEFFISHSRQHLLQLLLMN